MRNRKSFFTTLLVFRSFPDKTRGSRKVAEYMRTSFAHGGEGVVGAADAGGGRPIALKPIRRASYIDLFAAYGGSALMAPGAALW